MNNAYEVKVYDTAEIRYRIISLKGYDDLMRTLNEMHPDILSGECILVSVKMVRGT